MPRKPAPRPETAGTYYHVWTFYTREHRGKPRQFRDMKTLVKNYTTKSKASGNGAEAVYDTHARPAAWLTRDAAHKYGLRMFGRGEFDVEKCPGQRCPMKDHGSP